MRPLSRLLFSAFLLFGALNFWACNGDENPVSQVPNVPVNIRIDLNDPINFDLNPFGGYLVYTNEGNRGVVVYHNFDDTYSAIELTCTYEPTNPCSTLEVDESGLKLKCGQTVSGDFEKCCDSEFGWNGFPNTGPAQFPLVVYNVLQSGNIITVSN